MAPTTFSKFASWRRQVDTSLLGASLVIPVHLPPNLAPSLGIVLGGIDVPTDSTGAPSSTQTQTTETTTEFASSSETETQSGPSDVTRNGTDGEDGSTPSSTPTISGPVDTPTVAPEPTSEPEQPSSPVVDPSNSVSEETPSRIVVPAPTAVPTITPEPTSEPEQPSPPVVDPSSSVSEETPSRIVVPAPTAVPTITPPVISQAPRPTVGNGVSQDDVATTRTRRISGGNLRTGSVAPTTVPAVNNVSGDGDGDAFGVNDDDSRNSNDDNELFQIPVVTTTEQLPSTDTPTSVASTFTTTSTSVSPVTLTGEQGNPTASVSSAVINATGITSVSNTDLPISTGIAAGASSGSGIPVGAMAGGIAGGVVAILLIILAIFLVRRRRQRSRLSLGNFVNISPDYPFAGGVAANASSDSYGNGSGTPGRGGNQSLSPGGGSHAISRTYSDMASVAESGLVSTNVNGGASNTSNYAGAPIRTLPQSTREQLTVYVEDHDRAPGQLRNLWNSQPYKDDDSDDVKSIATIKPTTTASSSVNPFADPETQSKTAQNPFDDAASVVHPRALPSQSIAAVAAAASSRMAVPRVGIIATGQEGLNRLSSASSDTGAVKWGMAM